MTKLEQTKDGKSFDREDKSCPTCQERAKEAKAPSVKSRLEEIEARHRFWTVTITDTKWLIQRAKEAENLRGQLEKIAELVYMAKSAGAMRRVLKLMLKEYKPSEHPALDREQQKGKEDDSERD